MESVVKTNKQTKKNTIIVLSTLHFKNIRFKSEIDMAFLLKLSQCFVFMLK